MWYVDFPRSPVDNTLPSNAGGVGSIPGRGSRTPHASWPNNQNIKQKQYCNKDFKNGPRQKKSLKKKCGIYMCNGILLSHKNEWDLAICNNMDGPKGYYAKWNKPEKERQIPYNFIYMWNLKNKTNKQNKTETAS